MGIFECQHGDAALIRWTLRGDEERTVAHNFGASKDGDIICLRREDVKDRKGATVGCMFFAIPSEQEHLIKTAAAKLVPESAAVETELTEPANQKKDKKKKGGKE